MVVCLISLFFKKLLFQSCLSVNDDDKYSLNSFNTTPSGLKFRDSNLMNTTITLALGRTSIFFAQKHNAKSLSHAFQGAVVNYIFEPGCRSETRRSILG